MDRAAVKARIASIAVLAAAVTAIAAVSATAAAGAAPTSSSPPTIAGKFQVNETVTATNGSWAGSPTQFTYQWQRCNNAGTGCVSIAGATSKSYKLGSDDVNHTLVVLVTAANAEGKATAGSDASPIVSSAEAPRNTQRPAISGTAQVGETLTVSEGSWTGGVRSYTYQWQRCGADGNDCADVPGATAKTYGVRSQDSGKTVRVEVTAENGAGKTTVNTDRSAQVKPAGTPAPSPATSCDGARTIAAANLQLPTRLLIDRFTFEPSVVTLSTTQFVARVHVADTCGRAVSGANLWATAIPYNQTTTERGTTGSDGWATLTFSVLRGFPANPGRQQIMAMLLRATKPGDSVLAGVSTRRTVRQRVDVRS
jgi:hypothetical protein